MKFSSTDDRRLCAVALHSGPAAVAQWTPQQSNTDAEFRGLVAVSPTVVWASGTRGRVARTTDGGTTWKIDTVPGADSLDLRSIAARSATRAMAMTAGEAEKGAAKIFRTDDGTRWSQQFDTREKGAFLDAHRVLGRPTRHRARRSDRRTDCSCSRPTTAARRGRASDARTRRRCCPVKQRSRRAARASSCSGRRTCGSARAAAQRARVFRSTDRGRTWSRRRHAAPRRQFGGGNFLRRVLATRRHGVVVGGQYDQAARRRLDNVALTSDGGQTWTLAERTASRRVTCPRSRIFRAPTVARSSP